MQLSEWIKITGRTQTWVANKLGITTAMMWNYTHGIARPKLELVIEISILTDGEVKAEDWLKKGTKDEN